MHFRKMAIPATLGLASLLPAQDVVKDVTVEAPRAGVAVGGGVIGGTMMGVAGQASTFQFIAAEPGMMGKTVTGAPYAGEGFTETVRMLADGTRITNKTSKKVWRDAQGRTREEGTLPMLGPWAAEGEAPKFITIYDAVAKVVYTLNEKDKTAFKHASGGNMMAMKMMAEAKSGKGQRCLADQGAARGCLLRWNGGAGRAGAAVGRRRWPLPPGQLSPEPFTPSVAIPARRSHSARRSWKV